MKIAFVTEDGVRISNHFGQAPYYLVFSVENGQVQSQERREKTNHNEQDHHHNHGHNHESMFAPIADCQVMVAGGLGTPAYATAQSAGLDIILTGGEIQTALQNYLNSTLKSNPRRVHHPMHHHH